MNTQLTHSHKLTSHSAAILLLAILLVGCSKPIEKAIVGKWENNYSEEKFMEFFHDNTILISDGKQQWSGTWTKVGDDRIKVDSTMLGTTTTILIENIEISGNIITCKVDGQEGTLTRKK